MLDHFMGSTIHKIKNKARAMVVTRSRLHAVLYKRAFDNAWSDKNIVAVTPFLLHAEGEPFQQFSFIIDNKKTPLYEGYLNLPKTKGEPKIEPKTIQAAVKSTVLKTRYFTQEFSKTIYDKINSETKIFFKWLLKI